MICWPLDWTRSRICHIREILQPPDHAYCQILSDLNLAGEAHVGLRILHSAQPFLFGVGHRTCITIDDLDPAGGAACIATAAMQDVDSGILDTQNESTPLFTGRLADAFHDHLWHVELVPFTFISQPEGPGSARRDP